MSVLVTAELIDFLWSLETVQNAVETATGWWGFGIIFVYSFLIAFVLPLPSEVVLLAPLNLGIGTLPRLILIMLVSGVGKALGSLIAFHIGVTARSSGPVTRLFQRLGFDIMEWSERRSIELARRYGYFGLAVGLSVPFFPDTASIYAFSLLERDYTRFAIAVFIGSVMRLLVVAVFFRGILSI
ncbi:MAG: VTT domain-containing protein [Halobacteria archaeon]|nr:VTT domain-containing protein [Halobacteria archaeon]